MDSFAPGVIVDGKRVTPKGYVWILGFALAGCDWAIEKASKPEFLEMVRKDLTNENITELESAIQRYEHKIINLKTECNVYRYYLDKSGE
jgi:hypothetical protein